jgi:hypothetical protein
MEDFRNIIDFCDMFDIGFSGAPWTFDNRQQEDKNVKVRLDRVMASASWSSWFPEARLHHLVSSRSDDAPILLEMIIEENARRPMRIPHYEIMWERDKALPEEIRVRWQTGVSVHDLGVMSGNLRKVMSNLSVWSWEKFSAMTVELEKLRKRIEELSSRNNMVDNNELHQARQRMGELLARGNDVATKVLKCMAEGR